MSQPDVPQPVAQQSPATKLVAALELPNPSSRLQAAQIAGTRPDPSYIPVLIEQCRTEPDFYVRDMLTWALINHDRKVVVRQLLPQLDSAIWQARSQALHTLSKIADPDTWPAITRAHLTDPLDEVARTAWRAAAKVVPDDEKTALAEVFATQFGRGDRNVQLSLSRAFADLGPDVVNPVIGRARTTGTTKARTHAIATERLIANPDEGFDTALAEADRAVALRGAPMVDDAADGSGGADAAQGGGADGANPSH